MVSVLIPCYNEIPGPLVRQILSLPGKEYIKEIVIGNDGSGRMIRSGIEELAESNEKIRVVSHPENKGRSVMRNTLASHSSGKYLLFLDCDSKIQKEDFLFRYFNLRSPNVVIYGGRTYHDTPPENEEYILHWKYGTKREAKNIEKRRQHPFRSFLSNNFLTPRSLMTNIPFPEDIREYGYEDTYWAQILKKKDYYILHINNPVLHTGLTPRENFIALHKKAIKNLYEFHQKKVILPTRMMKIFRRILKSGQSRSVLAVISSLKNRIKRSLNSSNPSLRYFDLYRLEYLLRLHRDRE